MLTLLLLAASPVLNDVPFVAQKPDFCGEAVAAMALNRLGLKVTQDDVFNASGLDPLKGRGVWTDDLAKSLRSFGVEPGPTWYRVDPRQAKPQLASQFDALVKDLGDGKPSIVCMHYDASPGTTEHFRLVTGYDEARDEVIYQEPAEADGANRRMKRDDFLALWPFKPSRDKWTVIRLRMDAPGPLTPPATVRAPTPADLAQHVLELKKTLPAGMSLAYEAPFLVIGNESAATVVKRRELVAWTKRLLLKDFFAEVPTQLEELWVLGDAPTYVRLSKSLFNTDPDTPYGYYLSSRHALILNIRPGSGTLVHELVHPFMHQAWPEAPAWLNEGLASLFEFPYEDAGHLKGRVNWRLPALRSAIHAKRAPPFVALTHYSQNDFYDDDTGVHYAEARYMCHWLQQRGLLSRFVRRAIELKDKDGTGWQALTEVLGRDPETMRAEWEEYVLDLKS
jgi:hypothetical protein